MINPSTGARTEPRNGAPASPGAIGYHPPGITTPGFLIQVFGNDDVIWDVGAGCGGVASELSHWNERVSVYAVEQHPERLACLAENRSRFGCLSNMHIVDGRAPQALDDLPPANKVFIGGNDGELDAIITNVWARLPSQGLLVASSVTESTQAQLQAFALTLPGQQVETLQLAVSRGIPGDTIIDYQAKLPVTLFKFIKSELAS